MLSGRFTSPFLGLVLAACAGGGEPGGGPAQTGNADATARPAATATEVAPTEGEAAPGTGLTACEVITPADIEEVFDLDGGTVADGTLSSEPTTRDPDATECVYGSKDWGEVDVAMLPSDGARSFEFLASQTVVDTEAVAVGDGGLWFPGTRKGEFLKGTAMVTVQIRSVVDWDGSSFKDPTVALGTAAVARL